MGGDIMVYYQGTVISDELMIRNGPANSYAAISETLKKDDIVIITAIEQTENITWGKHRLGWSIVKFDRTNTIILEEMTGVRAPAEPDDDDTGTDEDDEDTDDTDNEDGDNEDGDDDGEDGEDGEDGDDTDTDASTVVDIVNLTDVVQYATANGEPLSKATMQLFGMPYQLNRFTDIRFEQTNTSVGRTYLENVIAQGPILTVIPCRPKYLGNVSDSNQVETFTTALNEWVRGSTALGDLVAADSADFRYYDLRAAYRECMRYVNLLNRFCCVSLNIGNVEYPPGSGSTLMQFDWKDYRFNGSKYSGVVGRAAALVGDSLKNVGDGIKAFFSNEEYDANEQATFDEMVAENEIEEDDPISNFFMTTSYMQFYCDADLNSTDVFENETADSMIKGLFNDISEWSKEIQFVMNSLAGDIGSEGTAYESFIGNGVEWAGNKITSTLGGSFGAFGGVLNKFLTLGTNVLAKGETVVIPDIYKGSSRRTSYTINIKLRAVYGNLLSQFFDIIAPQNHLLAIAAPQQTSSNTYGAPFMVKAIYDSVFTCNMGIIKGLDISRSSSNNWTIFGMPNEVDITVSLDDLYSDISITPPNHPTMFLNNVPLIEYLACACGLNVLKPNLAVKATLQWNMIANAVLADAMDYLIGNELDKLEDMTLSTTTLLNGLSVIG